MVTNSNPTLSTEGFQDELEEKINTLKHHIKVLNQMERQFLFGENIELPSATLEQWHKALIQQQTLVNKLCIELAKLDDEAL
jgi:hypothetical protein